MNYFRNTHIWSQFRNSCFCFKLSVINFRSLSISTIRSKKTFRNPLQKKINHRSNKREEQEVNRICVTILGNGALGQPRCIGLFADQKAFLFNCGEGVTRLLREYEAAFYQIRHVFITKRDWSNLSGLADLHLTHEAYGVHKLKLYGPPGVDQFMSLVTGEISSTKLVKRSTPYIDDTLEISAIYITADKQPKSIRRKNKSIEDDLAFSYCCKILEKPHELSPEKLVEHNVPIGPHLLKLKNGEDVVLPSGKIIHSRDVINLSNREQIILVVDCPSEDFLLPFVGNEEFIQYHVPFSNASKVSTVFHFSPSEIVNTKIYKDWMSRFDSETRHVILNTSCPSVCSKAVYQSQTLFHLLHPDIFKLLPVPKLEKKDLSTCSTVIQAPPMLQINFRPDETMNWSSVVNYVPENYIQDAKHFPDFIEEIKNLKSLIASKSKLSSKEIKEYPEVIFFGTGSSTSSAYRNVTAILLNVSSTKSFLLDCGEGTFMQLVRYFGAENISSELQKISCVFISHLHTDHYLGLFQLVKQRIEAFQKTGSPYQPLALILPYRIRDIFREFCSMFESFSSKVRIFNCKSLSDEGGRRFEKLQEFLGDIEIETVPVIHCIDAYGIVLKKDSDWKIVYSGDSAPCQKLIDAGENCTLLIHEASIEDGCLNEAMMRKHSTPAQVIDISEKMNAQHTIMTHFSKRYLAVPVFEESTNQNTGCAFDFMKVQLHQLPLVPLFLPAMKCLFQDQLEKHSERTSFVVNFENSFLKTYKVKVNSGHSQEC